MPLEMNRRIRAEWATRLRSGEIPQATGKLRDGGARCCFGVLCDMAVEADVITVAQDSFAGDWYYDGQRNYTTPAVDTWAGLPSFNPKVTINGRLAPLAYHNDNGATFAQIADAIDGGESK
jgi:hypothetical protein